MDEKSRVGVVRRQGQFSLVATETIAVGERLFRIEGERTSTPTRYSVQLEEDVHIDLGQQPLELVLDRYYWRFMNHHCEPNALIRGLDVYAARGIAPWEEITFNYNTTEYHMAEPFDCHCGSPHCLGQVSGFQQLSSAAREELRPWLAPYLVQLLDCA
jgi:hypothetical protein